MEVATNPVYAAVKTSRGRKLSSSFSALAVCPTASAPTWMRPAVRLATAKSQSGRTSWVIAMVSPTSISAAE